MDWTAFAIATAICLCMTGLLLVGVLLSDRRARLEIQAHHQEEMAKIDRDAGILPSPRPPFQHPQADAQPHDDREYGALYPQQAERPRL